MTIALLIQCDNVSSDYGLSFQRPRLQPVRPIKMAGRGQGPAAGPLPRHRNAQVLPLHRDLQGTTRHGAVLRQPAQPDRLNLRLICVTYGLILDIVSGRFTAGEPSKY